MLLTISFPGSLIARSAVPAAGTRDCHDLTMDVQTARQLTG
jgi:hypothetical protein